jgi:hypothetical protein
MGVVEGRPMEGGERGRRGLVLVGWLDQRGRAFGSRHGVARRGAKGGAMEGGGG